MCPTFIAPSPTSKVLGLAPSQNPVPILDSHRLVVCNGHAIYYEYSCSYSLVPVNSTCGGSEGSKPGGGGVRQSDSRITPRSGSDQSRLDPVGWATQPHRAWASDCRLKTIVLGGESRHNDTTTTMRVLLCSATAQKTGCGFVEIVAFFRLGSVRLGLFSFA